MVTFNAMFLIKQRGGVKKSWKYAYVIYEWSLSTKHFSGNRLLYEQVIYNFLRLVGIGRPGLKSSSLLPTTKEEFEMQVSDKDISVFVDDCASEKCSQPEACDQIKCKLWCGSSNNFTNLEFRTYEFF